MAEQKPRAPRARKKTRRTPPRPSRRSSRRRRRRRRRRPRRQPARGRARSWRCSRATSRSARTCSGSRASRATRPIIGCGRNRSSQPRSPGGRAPRGGRVPGALRRGIRPPTRATSTVVPEVRGLRGGVHTSDLVVRREADALALAVPRWSTRRYAPRAGRLLRSG